MYDGPCFVVIVEEKYHLDVTSYIYFTSYVLNMFRTLIYPSSGFSIETYGK
jgi:hypothetical protein